MVSRTIYYTNETKAAHLKLLKADIREFSDSIIIGFRDLFRLTEKNVPLVYESLLANIPPSGDIIFDLSNVESIDSRGLALLITLHDRFDNENRQFYLMNLKAALLRIFRITQIDQIIPIYMQNSDTEFDYNTQAQFELLEDLDTSYSDLDFIHHNESF